METIRDLKLRTLRNSRDTIALEMVKNSHFKATKRRIF